MKNLYRIFTSIPLCFASILYSQSLSPLVISSSGGFYTDDAAMLSFTTGELAAIKTYSNGTSTLTQGFQQPWDLGTYIDEHPFKDFSFGIYPNPSNGQFFLLTDSDLSLQMTVTISNLLGQQVNSIHFDQSSKVNIESIDISEMPAGSYILTMLVKENNTSHENIFNTKITIVK